MGKLVELILSQRSSCSETFPEYNPFTLAAAAWDNRAQKPGKSMLLPKPVRCFASQRYGSASLLIRLLFNELYNGLRAHRLYAG
jgi:hypothetical protein